MYDYINLVEAAEILNESIVLTRLRVKKGNLITYVITPEYFQQNKFYFNKDEEIFEPFSRLLLADMFDESLAKCCQLIDPEWNDGNIVTCKAIKVFTQSGNIPTVKIVKKKANERCIIETPQDMIESVCSGQAGRFSNPPIGRIEKDGKIYFYSGWKFDEKELLLNETELYPKVAEANILEENKMPIVDTVPPSMTEEPEKKKQKSRSSDDRQHAIDIAQSSRKNDQNKTRSDVAKEIEVYFKGKYKIKAIKDWIADLFPEDLKKHGAPKKNI